MYQAAELL